MKRICLLLFSILLCASIMAQGRTGKPSYYDKQIPAGSSISVIFDYSETLFKGYDLEDYSSIDEDFPNDIKETENNRFLIPLAEKFLKSKPCQKRQLRLILNPDKADYILVIKPASFNDHGDFVCDAILKDVNGDIIFELPGIGATGGNWGSYANLIGDAYERYLGHFMYFFEGGLNKKKI